MFKSMVTTYLNLLKLPTLSFSYTNNAKKCANSYFFFVFVYFQANFKIKGWKQRWFVLDSTKHELRYYDTREDFQCKGVVPLHEVNNTQVGNNTTPGAPKKSEDKCFFELQTVKRNYCFCAESKIDAERWVNKIQMCLQ